MTEKKEISQDTKVIIAGNLVMVIFCVGAAWGVIKVQDSTFQRDLAENKLSIVQHIDQTREEPVKIGKLETSVASMQADITAIKNDVKELLGRRS